METSLGFVTGTLATTEMTGTPGDRSSGTGLLEATRQRTQMPWAPCGVLGLEESFLLVRAAVRAADAVDRVQRREYDQHQDGANLRTRRLYVPTLQRLVIRMSVSFMLVIWCSSPTVPVLSWTVLVSSAAQSAGGGSIGMPPPRSTGITLKVQFRRRGLRRAGCETTLRRRTARCPCRIVFARSSATSRSASSLSIVPPGQSLARRVREKDDVLDSGRRRAALPCRRITSNVLAQSGMCRIDPSAPESTMSGSSTIQSYSPFRPRDESVEAHRAAINHFPHRPSLAAARGESPAAFGRRCIPGGCVAPRSNTAGILGRRALPPGRLGALGATPAFHHGLLTLNWALARTVEDPVSHD